MKKKHIFNLSLLSVLLVSLSGCFGGGEKKGIEAEIYNDGSEVLISIDGKPKMTVKSFEKFLETISEGNDQLKMMLQIMPDAKEQVFKGKKQALIFSEYADREGIKNTQEYKKKKAQLLENVDMQLNGEFFVKNHKADVSDEDVKKFYDENKDKDPRLLKTPAGVKVEAVSFSSKEKAEEFKNKATGSTFEKVVKEEKLKDKKLGQDGLVTEQSWALADNVRKDILKAKPKTIILVKDGSEWLVINIKSKTEVAHHPFDVVKEGLKQLVQQQKTQDIVENKTKEYADKYGVKEHTKYFDDIKKKQEEEAKNASEEFEKNQQLEAKNKVIQQTPAPEKNEKELVGEAPTGPASTGPAKPSTV